MYDSVETDLLDITRELGEPKPESKRRNRKSKKQNEKEIMNEYYSDFTSREQSVTKQRKFYENIQ